jgi:Protein of unknown function (DUF2752)
LKVCFARVPRPFPMGFVLGLVGGIALAGFYFLWNAGVPGIGGCRFRDFARIPCPTCGGSRCISALFHGHPGAAFMQNPAVMAGILILWGWFLISLAAEVIGRREIEVDFSRAEKTTLRILAVTVPLANWAYLLARNGS